MVPANRPALLTDVEAAAYLRHSPSTLRSWRCLGSGPPYVKLSGRVFYRQSDLDEYIEQRIRRRIDDSSARKYPVKRLP